MPSRNIRIALSLDKEPELDALITRISQFQRIPKSTFILHFLLEHKDVFEELATLLQLHNEKLAARAAEMKDEYLPF